MICSFSSAGVGCAPFALRAFGGTGEGGAAAAGCAAGDVDVAVGSVCSCSGDDSGWRSASSSAFGGGGPIGFSVTLSRCDCCDFKGGGRARSAGGCCCCGCCCCGCCCGWGGCGCWGRGDRLALSGSGGSFGILARGGGVLVCGGGVPSGEAASGASAVTVGCCGGGSFGNGGCGRGTLVGCVRARGLSWGNGGGDGCCASAPLMPAFVLALVRCVGKTGSGRWRGPAPSFIFVAVSRVVSTTEKIHTRTSWTEGTLFPPRPARRGRF